MKKQTIILGSLLAMANLAYSQWTTSGSNIYKTTTGNVGIGNTSPIFALDITSSVHEDGIRIQETGTGQCGIHLNANTTGGGHRWSLYSNGSANSNGGTGNFSINDNTSLFLPRFVISGSTGNIGIGTTAPTAKLDIRSTDPTVFSVMDAPYPSGTYEFRFKQSPVNLGSWVLNSAKSYGFGEDNSGIGHIWSDVNNSYKILNFKSIYGSNAPQVWIGNATPKAPHTDFMFAVQGKMVAQSLYVTATTEWADYVFANDYKLPNLYDIEKYYKANKHLPEIPSAAEVKENGINVGEMNTLLLKKIEEMTILMVNQQREIDELKTKIK